MVIINKVPSRMSEVLERAKKLNFTMSCDYETGNLLKTLASSKPGGSLLELGTGAGVSTLWIIDGMDCQSTLVSIEMDENVQNIAKSIINDDRINFITIDGGIYIEENKHKMFDFIFADTWPGKYYLLEEALGMVKAGGFYIIDDLTPIDSWTDKHREDAINLVRIMKEHEDFNVVEINWSTGIIIASRK